MTDPSRIIPVDLRPLWRYPDAGSPVLVIRYSDLNQQQKETIVKIFKEGSAVLRVRNKTPIETVRRFLEELNPIITATSSVEDRPFHTSYRRVLDRYVFDKLSRAIYRFSHKRKISQWDAGVLVRSTTYEVGRDLTEFQRQEIEEMTRAVAQIEETPRNNITEANVLPPGDPALNISMLDLQRQNHNVIPDGAATIRRLAATFPSLGDINDIDPFQLSPAINR